VTLAFLFQRAEKFLRHRGIAPARAEAGWLLAHVLGCRRWELPLRLREPVGRKLLAEFLPLLRRRGGREPLQYILKRSEFYNVSLRSDRRVLIPRPETEELVEWLVREWQKRPPASILDLGTGSGAIGIALAKVFSQSRVTAVDIEPPALELAKENARENRVTNITFLRSDWFEGVSGRFDRIVANPPYLSAEELESAGPEVRDHEPQRALLAAEEGRAELLKILRAARDFMEPAAWLVLEMGIAHGNSLKAEAQKLGFGFTRVRHDLSGRPRFFIAGREPLIA